MADLLHFRGVWLAGVTLALSAVGCGGAPELAQSSDDMTEQERAAWVRAELTAQNSWLTDELRAEKYGKMAASPFAFYRGSNHLFWADFSADERRGRFGDETTATWLQGDLHVNNYGAFHDDEGVIVYDLNDFDEALVADYQLDLWRGAVSLVLVARELQLSDQDVGDFADAFTESYLDTAASYRGNDDEIDHAVTADSAYGRLDDFLIEVAADESREKMLGKWTVVVDGQRELDLSSGDLAALDEARQAAIAGAWLGYGTTLSGKLAWDPAHFAVKSVARRLHAGVGSLGVARYYVLIEGPTASVDDDIILDVKRSLPPTGLQYLPGVPYPFDSHAERAVVAQKALGTHVDDHLGWLVLDGEAFLVRERSPFKETFPTEELDSHTRFVKLAEQWGAILATDHCRADRDFDESLVPRSFDQAVDELTDGHHDEVRALVREVARGYATQVEKDFQSFLPLASP